MPKAGIQATFSPYWKPAVARSKPPTGPIRTTKSSETMNVNTAVAMAVCLMLFSSSRRRNKMMRAPASGRKVTIEIKGRFVKFIVTSMSQSQLVKRLSAAQRHKGKPRHDHGDADQHHQSIAANETGLDGAQSAGRPRDQAASAVDRAVDDELIDRVGQERCQRHETPIQDRVVEPVSPETPIDHGCQETGQPLEGPHE